MIFPLVVLFLLPLGGLFQGTVFYWLAVVLWVLLLSIVLGLPLEETLPTTGHEMHDIRPDERPAFVQAVMDVREAFEQAGARIFRGRLLVSPSAAYEKLKQESGEGITPALRKDGRGGATIILAEKFATQVSQNAHIRPWVHWFLLGLTFLTTTWAGAAAQGIDLFREPRRFTVGLPYSLGLLTILGIHELGHYFAARRRGVQVTPPYCIPVPLSLGTFGAFIQMRSPAEDRKALFDVAVAGPLAGVFSQRSTPLVISCPQRRS